MSTLVAVDAGNGITNAAKDTKNGYELVAFPSGRAEISGDTLDTGNEMEFEWFEWNGTKYAVGDEALNASGRYIRPIGRDRYGEEFHQFLVAVACCQLGIKKGGIDLTLFAPTENFRERRAKMEANFLQNGGQVSMRVKVERSIRKFNYDTVRVLPEGLAAAFCFTMDEKGNSTNDDTLAGDVLIVDIGAYTLDVIYLINGQFNVEYLDKSSYAKFGLFDTVYSKISNKVNSMGRDWSTKNDNDIDATIRQGIATGDYSISSAGKSIDLKPMLTHNVQRYTDAVINDVFERHYDGLRGIKSMILVGGGADLMELYFKDTYGNKVVNSNTHPRTRDIGAVYMNAVGGLRSAKAIV